MVKTIKLTDMNSVLELIKEQEYNNDIHRYRSPYLYRGLPNEQYNLATSLQRNCKDKQSVLEKCILRNFTKYAATDDPQLKESIWRQMIIGQHHGLPTRLLDWTYSQLIALHFATSGEDLSSMDKHDCALWRIDNLEFNSLLPCKYRDELKDKSAYLFTIDMLESVVTELEEYDKDMSKNAMVLLEPPSIDQRIISQYSYFSVVPNSITDIECFLEEKTSNTVKYIIDKDLRWRIRDMLDQLNINERIVYPGLDGLSAWLKRHYYVKS